MTKLLGLLFTLISAIPIAAQTRQITSDEWKTVMKGQSAFPSNPAGVPYRMIFWSNSFEQGDPMKNSSRTIITENFGAREGRERQESRVGTRMTVEFERIWKGNVEYRRPGNSGEWALQQNNGGQGQYRLGPGIGSDSTKPGPDGRPPVFARKPGSNEVLYFALGERLYKREMVAVYEEVTRHVLTRLADQTEIHYENRTRFWFTHAGRMIRVDRNYVIYGDKTTTRILSGYEWENDPAIKPVELPAK